MIGNVTKLICKAKEKNKDLKELRIELNTNFAPLIKVNQIMNDGKEMQQYFTEEDFEKYLKPKK